MNKIVCYFVNRSILKLVEINFTSVSIVCLNYLSIITRYIVRNWFTFWLEFRLKHTSIIAFVVSRVSVLILRLITSYRWPRCVVKVQCSPLQTKFEVSALSLAWVTRIWSTYINRASRLSSDSYHFPQRTSCLLLQPFCNLLC